MTSSIILFLQNFIFLQGTPSFAFSSEVILYSLVNRAQLLSIIPSQLLSLLSQISAVGSPGIALQIVLALSLLQIKKPSLSHSPTPTKQVSPTPKSSSTLLSQSSSRLL